MKKFQKKFLICVLSGMLIMSIAVPASASENIMVSSGTQTMENRLNVQYEDAVVAFGECGTNATWSLDSEGTLTVSGMGEMEDYGSEESPVYSYRESIKKAVIGKNITYLGSCFFESCLNLSMVSFEEESQLAVIGGNAFRECENLTDIVLPESLNKIDGNAFTGCISLEKIIIPNGLTSLDSAFRCCTNLKYIYIPETVTSISDLAFGESPNVIIYGKKNSYAYRFAERMKIAFMPDGVPAIKSIRLSKTSAVYNGKIQNPKVTIKNENGEKLIRGTDYDIQYTGEFGNIIEKGCKEAGTYFIIVKFKGDYAGEKNLKYSITPLKLRVKSVKKTLVTFKHSVLKNKSKSFYMGIRKNVSYNKKDIITKCTVVKYYGKASKYIKVKKYNNYKSTGKVTVKKKTPKGTYKVSVKISFLSPTGNFKTASKTVTLKIKVK